MRIVIADGNNLSIASASVTGSLVNGTLFGFMNTLLAMARDCSPIDAEKSTFVVAWDSKECWRNRFYPEYKQNRRDDTNLEKKAFFEKFKEQRKRIQTILELLPIQQLWVNGFEADDIAGQICAQKPEEASILLVSNDDDWTQLVSSKISLYKPRTGRRVGVGASFQEHVGVPDGPSFARVKAIMGDAGDNVPGAVGVGESSAKAFVNGQSIRGDRLKSIQEWMANPDGFARSFELVNLIGAKNEKYGYTYQYDKRVGKYNPTELEARFTHYGFASILKKFKERTAPLDKYDRGIADFDSIL